MNINNIYRDKTIDCITEEDVGKSCKVAGWVENIRDHGGVFLMVCLRRTA